MFVNDITIGSNTFAKQSVRPLSASYADNNQPLDNPRLLTISHEVAKSGQVSSIVMIDDTKVIPVGTTFVNSKARVFMKIQYNPLQGRSDLVAAINAAITELTTFVGVAGNITKLLNKES